MTVKITKIAGAIDMLFECGLRIWWPPNYGAPYFTQPTGWLKTSTLQRFTPINLTREEVRHYSQFLKCSP